MLHAHVLLVAPLGTGYMVQPDANQHEGRVAVREGSLHTDPSANLPVQPFNHIVGENPGPVLAGKITVGQRFLNTVLHLLGGLFQFHFPKLGHHGFSLFTGSLLAFLGVDRPEHLSHQLYLEARNGEKHISVKMDCAVLIFVLGQHISYGFQHSQTLVPNNELHAAHLDIWILTALQRTITPILNTGIRLLIQLADSGRRFLASPKSFLNILHPAYRDAGEVYINGGFFYAATNRSLDLPPDYFPFSCTIFSDMVYRLFSEWYVLTLFYQIPANHVSFYSLFNSRNLSCLIHPPATMVEFSAALTKAGKHITLFYHQCSSIMLSISTSVVFIPSRPILPTAAIVFSISHFTSPSPF